MLTVVAILGIFLIGFSRSQRQPDLTRPRVGADHWHSAIGFDICGTFAPTIPDNGQDPLGIHTHGDGVIHTHPFSSAAAGRRATLGVYFETLDLSISETKIDLPGQDSKSNGDRCGDKEGKVQAKVWDTRAPTDNGRVITGNPSDIRLGDNQLITVAFVPEGTEIRRPPSEPELDRLTDLGPAATPTTLPGATTIPGDATAPGETPTTAGDPTGPNPDAPVTSTSVP